MEQKLGDTLDLLNYSIRYKDMENVLRSFKLIKQNKYSLFIEADKKNNNSDYNNISLTFNNEKINKNLD